MTRSPRAGLGRVLDDLGTTLLELVHGDRDPGGDVGGIVIHDRLDAPVLPSRSLVLGVGVGGAEQVAHLLHDLGAAGAVGLVVRSPVPTEPEVLAAAEASGVALLGLTRGATWSQLAAMLRSLLAEGDVGVAEPESLGGLPSGDVFALANAIAALLDAPVTIEDRSNRVLAFSGRQDEADRSRVETILGLQVPERYLRVLSERGVFRDLYRSDRPVTVDPVPIDSDVPTMPRVAIAVRAGDEVLGSIWAAVSQPLSDERAEALCDAAKLVALHLLRIRAGADVERRLTADLVGTALEGGAGARGALNRLGLLDEPVVVLALSLTESAVIAATAEAGLTHERRRLSDAFALHLSAVHPRSATALVGQVTYGLVPVSREGEDGGAQWAARIATDFLDRVGGRVPGVVAVGSVARDVAGLARARDCAERTLRVLREEPVTRRVAALSDVYGASLMSELRDVAAARGDMPTGGIARLIEYDARHSGGLVQTLWSWLDAFGDVNAAAAAVFVHPNTFRYRLRRLSEIAEIDLADPEARFAALLQLRVLLPAPWEA